MDNPAIVWTGEMTMDEEKTLVSIMLYSKKTNDFVECGVDVPSKDPSADEIAMTIKERIEMVLDSLEECFWEVLSEFENSAQVAFDNGVISGTDREELFKVFGHFCCSCKVGGEPVSIDLGIEPDDYMYPLLVEYMEINM